MEEIKKNDKVEKLEERTDDEATPYIDELKKYVLIDEDSGYKSFHTKHWDAVAYDMLEIGARVDVMVKTAESTLTLISAYDLCDEEKKPIVSDEYVELVKNNIKHLLEYYVDFRDVMNKSHLFASVAIKKIKRCKAQNACMAAIKASLDFLKKVEKTVD